MDTPDCRADKTQATYATHAPRIKICLEVAGVVLNLVIEHLKVALGSNCTFMCVWVWVGTSTLPLIPSNPPLFLPALSLSPRLPLLSSRSFCSAAFTRLGQRAGGLRSCGSICIDYFYCTINFSETWLVGLVFRQRGLVFTYCTGLKYIVLPALAARWQSACFGSSHQHRLA